MEGKKRIYLERNTCYRQCGPSQGVSMASECGMVSFYELGNFIGDFPGASVVKKPPANAGDPASVPGLGRSPGERSGNPLQRSCLRSSRDRGTW